MKILILGLNYAPERVGIAVYTSGMAEALVAMGHEVQVIAGRPYYPAWRIMEGHSAVSYGRTTENAVDITRVPHYIPRDPSGIKRLLHHASFALAALFPMLGRGLGWRPDVVVTVAPSLIAAPLARLAASLCGAQSWLHIQDFEVEAAFATGLLKEQSWLGALALRFERYVMAKFDRISTISPQMCRRLGEKGIDQRRIVEFRNWSDIEAVQPLATPSRYRADWGVTTPQVALYSGNIANKQGIEVVIKAARLLRDRKDLSFIVCGEGPNRANLEAQAVGLTNIQFQDLQPKERLSELLGLATIHLLPQIAEAADLLLPSKLTNMLATGRPVVATALPGTGLHGEVDGCGLLVTPEDAEAFAAAIAHLCDNAILHQQLGAAARVRAETRWSGATTLPALERELTNLVVNKFSLSRSTQ
ncbi:MAG TPA: WcaI family glycosyltransferase [Devosia sp.]|nr:WcaI family glycosyltransferase [Devosia sp.]